jgi:hypothetical protein
MGQKVGLRMHLAICALCRGYRRNLEMLGAIAARAGDAVMSAFGRTDVDLALPTDSKQRIKEALEKERRAE